MAWAWVLQSLLTEWMEPKFPDNGVFRATNLSCETEKILLKEMILNKDLHSSRPFDMFNKMLILWYRNSTDAMKSALVRDRKLRNLHGYDIKPTMKAISATCFGQ